MQKNIITIVSIIILIGACGSGWYYYNTEKYAPEVYVTDTPGGEVTTNTTTGTTSTTTPTYSMADITTHNSATSCYSAINSSVYDLTAFINMHPGGKGAILSICGNDGTEKFMKMHKGGEKFMKILARYKIGKLTQ
jgi:cytochrome b involved in lipid metabolism